MSSCCELVNKRIVKRKGKPSIELYDKNDKPIYGCEGYYNPRYEEPFDECRRCKKFVFNIPDNSEELER